MGERIPDQPLTSELIKEFRSLAHFTSWQAYKDVLNASADELELELLRRRLADAELKVKTSENAIRVWAQTYEAEKNARKDVEARLTDAETALARIARWDLGSQASWEQNARSMRSEAEAALAAARDRQMEGYTDEAVRTRNAALRVFARDRQPPETP